MVTLLCKYTHPDFRGVFTFRGECFRNGARAWEFLHEFDNEAHIIYFSAEKDVRNMELVDNSAFHRAFGGSPDLMEYPWLNRNEV